MAPIVVSWFFFKQMGMVGWNTASAPAENSPHSQPQPQHTEQYDRSGEKSVDSHASNQSLCAQSRPAIQKEGE